MSQPQPATVVLSGRIMTALTGCRRELSSTGATEVHEHGCTHRRSA